MHPSYLWLFMVTAAEEEDEEDEEDEKNEVDSW